MHPTHHQPTSTAPAGTSPAEILRAAAVYLSRHGWTRDEYYQHTPDSTLPRACAIGAIGMAAFGTPHEDPFARHDGDQDFAHAIDVLTDHLYLTDPAEPDELTLISDWNDQRGRTPEQVIAALHAAADSYDRDHTATGGAR